MEHAERAAGHTPTGAYANVRQLPPAMQMIGFNHDGPALFSLLTYIAHPLPAAPAPVQVGATYGAEGTSVSQRAPLGCALCVAVRAGPGDHAPCPHP